MSLFSTLDTHGLYDKLKETRLEFRYLAYSMINFRITFNDS